MSITAQKLIAELGVDDSGFKAKFTAAAQQVVDFYKGSEKGAKAQEAAVRSLQSAELGLYAVEQRLTEAKRNQLVAENSLAISRNVLEGITARVAQAERNFAAAPDGASGKAYAAEQLAKERRLLENATLRVENSEGRLATAIERTAIVEVNLTEAVQKHVFSLETLNDAALVHLASMEQQEMAEAALKTEIEATNKALAERSLVSKVFMTGNIGNDKMKEALSNMEQIGRRTREIGQQLTLGISVPLTFIGAEATKTAVNYEAAVDKIEGLTNASKDSVEKWRGQFVDIAPQLGQTAEKFAEAGLRVASGGETGAAGLDVLKESSKASVAGLGDLTDVAKAATYVMYNYGLSSGQASKAVDFLVSAVREGNVAIDSVAPTIGRLLPISAALGIKLSDVGAAIASMTRAGFSADRAVTSLQTALVSLEKNGPATQKVLAKIGMTTQELVHDMQDDFLGALIKVNAKLNEHNMDLGNLFQSQRSLGGMLALVGKNVETNRGIFERFNAQIGQTDRSFDAMKDSSKFALMQMTGSVTSAAIAIGNMFAPTVVELAHDITSVANSISHLDPGLQSTVVTLSLVAIAAGPVLYVSGQMIITFTNIVKISVAWRAGSEALSVALFGQAAAETAAATSGAALTVVIGAALLPLALLAAAVGAVIFAYEKIKGAYDDIANASKVTTDKLNAEAQAHVNSATTAADHASKLASLYKEMQTFGQKTNKSTEEIHQMRLLMGEIGDISPNLVLQYNNQGQAVAVLGGQYDILARKAHDAVMAMQMADLHKDVTQRATQSSGLQDKLRSAQGGLSLFRRTGIVNTSDTNDDGTYPTAIAGSNYYNNVLKQKVKEVTDIQSQLKALSDAQGHAFREAHNLQSGLRPDGKSWSTPEPKIAVPKTDLFLGGTGGDAGAKKAEAARQKYAEYVESLNDKLNKLHQTLAEGGKLTKAETLGYQLQAAGIEKYGAGLNKLSAPHKAHILNLQQEIVHTQHLIDLQKEQIKAHQDIVDAIDDVRKKTSQEKLISGYSAHDQKMISAFPGGSEKFFDPSIPKADKDSFSNAWKLANDPKEVTARVTAAKAYRLELIKSDEALEHMDTYMAQANEHIAKMSEGLIPAQLAAKDLQNSFSLIRNDASKLDLDKAAHQLEDAIKPLEKSSRIALQVINGGKFDARSDALTNFLADNKEKIKEIIARGGADPTAQMSTTFLKNYELEHRAEEVDSYNKKMAELGQTMSNLYDNDKDPFKKWLDSQKQWDDKTHSMTLPSSMSFANGAPNLEAAKGIYSTENLLKIQAGVAEVENESQSFADRMVDADPFKAWLRSIGALDTETNRVMSGLDAKGMQRTFVLKQNLGMLNEFMTGTRNIFDNVFDDILNKGFKKLFQGVVQGFQQLLEKMAIEYLQSYFWKLLMQSVSGIAAKIGGGGGGTSFVAGPGGMNLAGMATGGQYQANDIVRVGEHGPELFLSQNAGQILPNHVLNSMMSTKSYSAANSSDNSTHTNNYYVVNNHYYGNGSGAKKTSSSYSSSSLPDSVQASNGIYEARRQMNRLGAA